MATIKELILAGKSKEEIMQITGCTYATYNTERYRMRKQGLIKEPERKPMIVNCNQSVMKKCVYSANLGAGRLICDYLCKTGHMRGCSPKECNKFEKR